MESVFKREAVSSSSPSTIVHDGRCSLIPTVRKCSTCLHIVLCPVRLLLIISYQDVRSVLSRQYVEHVGITTIHEEKLNSVDFLILPYPRLRNVQLKPLISNLNSCMIPSLSAERRHPHQRVFPTPGGGEHGDSAAHHSGLGFEAAAAATPEDGCRGCSDHPALCHGGKATPGHVLQVS